MSSCNPKQPFINGCFSWMIPNLYIGNGCFTKHPFINGCLGFQVVLYEKIGDIVQTGVRNQIKKSILENESWLVNQPPLTYPPPRNKGLIAGLIKGNRTVFISPDHKGPRLFLGGGYVRPGGGWLTSHEFFKVIAFPSGSFPPLTSPKRPPDDTII